MLSQATHQRTLLEAAGSADAIAMKGEADAFALEAKAKASAQVMELKGDAWKEYHKAAKVRPFNQMQEFESSFPG